MNFKFTSGFRHFTCELIGGTLVIATDTIRQSPKILLLGVLQQPSIYHNIQYLHSRMQVSTAIKFPDAFTNPITYISKSKLYCNIPGKQSGLPVDILNNLVFINFPSDYKSCPTCGTPKKAFQNRIKIWNCLFICILWSFIIIYTMLSVTLGSTAINHSTRLETIVINSAIHMLTTERPQILSSGPTQFLLIVRVHFLSSMVWNVDIYLTIKIGQSP